MHCSECHNPHTPGPVLREEEPPVAAESGVVTKPLVAVPAVASKCAKCHGRLGEGVRRSPPLAGMEVEVFMEKMRMYQAGASDSKIMIRFAKAMSDEDLAVLAAFYAGLPADPASDADVAE